MIIKNKNSVKKRLIKRVLLFSVLITVVVTVCETYVSYQNNLSQLKDVDRQIQGVFLPTISADVWALNRDNTLSHMGLILSQPMIEMVELRIEQGETLKIGDVKSQEIKTLTYKLVYDHNDRSLEIGTLFVSASLDRLLEQAKLQALTTLAGNSFIVFFVSFLVVFLTKTLITRHLVDISENLTSSFSQGDTTQPLVLNRKISACNRGDELEHVVNAINDMRINIISSYEQVQKSQERLSQIADNSLMWIWEVDKDGLYTYCSDTCEYLFGYTAKEVVGKNHFYDFFHPDDREKLKQAAFDVFERQQNLREFENRNINRAGDVVWLSKSGVPILDSNGRLIGYRGADVDISERKKLMEDQSRAAQLAALGTVAAGVAHEINNPIQGIMNYAGLIKMSPDKVKRNSDIAERILAESKRIAKITQDLLFYSKDNRLERTEVDVKETVESAISLIATKIRNHNVSIETDIQTDLPNANWQAQSIQQVILNLVDNAYDALRVKQNCSEQKRILVRVKLLRTEDPPKVSIEVQDNGIGMSGEIMRRVQEAFFTTKPPSEGTGLGLSIVNDIVTKHNGSLTIDSKEGQYSRFTVILPLS